MYAGVFLNNLEQHTNIDHNNDVDNHVIIPFIFIRILLVMQIRIGLIPLITATFVFYTWQLPWQRCHQNIYVSINETIYFENTLVKPSFKVT